MENIRTAREIESERLAKKSAAPDLNELASLMRKAFEQHVDGLVTASINGVKIVPKKHLDNVQVELHVSPSAYAALQMRFDKTPK